MYWALYSPLSTSKSRLGLPTQQGWLVCVQYYEHVNENLESLADHKNTRYTTHPRLIGLR